MSISAVRSGRTIRLALKGAMALGRGSGSLQRAVARALARGASRIELDAAGVRFFDAAGLGELVSCRAMAEAAGARLILRGAGGKLRQVLRMTGLERRLSAGSVTGPGSPLNWRIA